MYNTKVIKEEKEYLQNLEEKLKTAEGQEKEDILWAIEMVKDRISNLEYPDL